MKEDEIKYDPQRLKDIEEAGMNILKIRNSKGVPNKIKKTGFLIYKINIGKAYP